MFVLQSTGGVKKKRDLRRLVKNCNFFVQLSCMVFFSIFFENLYLFWYFNDPKKTANLFSLKIKNSEKQKCVNKLFLSKSKILKRMNLRISENLQNCNKKISNFQFWSNFYGKIVFQWS